jgi:hypothetical protein
VFDFDAQLGFHMKLRSQTGTVGTSVTWRHGVWSSPRSEAYCPGYQTSAWDWLLLCRVLYQSTEFFVAVFAPNPSGNNNKKVR